MNHIIPPCELKRDNRTAAVQEQGVSVHCLPEPSAPLLMLDFGDFWKQYFHDVEALPKDSSLGDYANTARRHLQKETAIISIAWSSHVLLSTENLLIQRRIGCLCLLHSVCVEMDSVQSLWEWCIRHVLHNLLADGGIVMNELAESLLPQILGPQRYQLHGRALMNPQTASEAAKAALDEAVVEWMTSNDDDVSSFSPILWESDVSDSSMEITDATVLLKPHPPITAPFDRPLPINLDLKDELVWLAPSHMRLMLIPDRPQEYRSLWGKAFEEPLTPQDQRILLRQTSTFLRDDKLLKPESLPRLVEANPNVAYECLVYKLKNKDQEDDFLSSLVNMKVSLHSMEVVHRLATQSDCLHPEYVQLYIHACLAACEYDNVRLVRLVCVWIQSLLKNGILQVDDVYWQVQAFCVQHSKVREASALYKSLQAMQKK